MRIKNYIALCLVTLLSVTTSSVLSSDANAKKASASFGIVATVNDDAISKRDLDDRMRLIFASAGMPATKESQAKVKPQALDILIDEQLKIQEATRNNMSVTEEEIDEAFAKMAAQNKMEAAQFSEVMKKSGIPASTLRRQIKAQLAWTKVIGGILRPRIDVTENDINTKMDRLKQNIGQTEYKVSEVFLPVNKESEDAKTKDLGLKLIEEIKKGRASFELVAAQFSKSASAVQGGSMGWVQENELPKELDVVVKSLSDGQISSPVKGMSGYHILTVTETRTVTEETLPPEDEVLNAIGLQRLDKLQKRHLDDLRSASFIDRRIEE